LGFISHLPKVNSAPARFELLIAALLFSLPLGQEGFTNILLFALFIQSLIAYRWPHWREGFKDPLWILSALFYGYLFLSITWAEDQAGGLRQMETKTAFLLAPLFILAGKKLWPITSREFALKAFWWGCMVAMLWALSNAAIRSWEAGAMYITHEAGRRYFFAYTHLASPLMHPGYLAAYLGLGLFSAVELQDKAKKNWQWIYRLSIVFLIVFMVLLQARINLIALFMVIGLAALFLAWQRKAYIWLGLPLLPILALGLFMGLASEDMQKRYFQVPDFDYDISGTDFNSATYRLAEWKCASEVIESNFWYGTGIGDNRQALFDSYKANRFWEGLNKGYNAHNQYLETMIAGGVPAVVLLTLLLLYYTYRALRQMDFLALSGLLFLMISLSTESMFERIWGVLIFTLFFPFLLMRTKESDSTAY